jgi:hypothetical protein
MPCYEPSDAEYARDRARLEFRHNSEVAQMLCDLMKQLLSGKGEIDVSPQLAQWWNEHEQRDRAKGRYVR